MAATKSLDIPMSKQRTDLDTEPACTTNQLADVISWLNLGDYVILHSGPKIGRVFHSKCSSSKIDDDFFENTRVIYVNVGRRWADLLNDGEWEYYIKQAGHEECHCELRSQIRNSSGLPHHYTFSC